MIQQEIFSIDNTHQISTEVLMETDLNIKWGSQKHLLLLAYKDQPNGLIDEEAGTISGLRKIRSCGYWKKCSELRKAGYIQPTGNTRKSECNKNQSVSKITSRGLQKLASIVENPIQNLEI
jgi:hypothetical protein